jgi:pimeloyl-ACP methyl ester carboxylesterase
LAHQMRTMKIKTAKLAYRIFGSGPVGMVIEPGLNASSAEWWHIAERLSNNAAVLVYDRAGYGRSSLSKLARTPQHIAEELHDLLSGLDTADKLVFIGHSIGGLYIQQYARRYPEKVKGLILLDPMSANHYRLPELLSKEEYDKSGMNKLTALKLAELLTRYRLGLLFRRFLRQGPPFTHYRDFTKEAERYILRGLVRYYQNRAAVKEYELSQTEEHVKHLKEVHSFPKIPVVLITHTSHIVIDEIMRYEELGHTGAQNVEKVWQNVMQDYLSFSDYSDYIQAANSGHYIHLTEPEYLETAMKFVLR